MGSLGTASVVLGAGNPARSGLPAGTFSSKDTPAAAVEREPLMKRGETCAHSSRRLRNRCPELLAWTSTSRAPLCSRLTVEIKGGEHNSGPVPPGELPVGGICHHCNCVSPLSVRSLSLPDVSNVCVNQCTFSRRCHSGSFFLSGSSSSHGDVGLQTSSACA